MTRRSGIGRRKADRAAWDIALGRCLDPIVIMNDPRDPRVVRCQKCIACRVFEKLGDDMINEISRYLNDLSDRRRIRDRRVMDIPIYPSQDRRMSAGRRDYDPAIAKRRRKEQANR